MATSTQPDLQTNDQQIDPQTNQQNVIPDPSTTQTDDVKDNDNSNSVNDNNLNDIVSQLEKMGYLRDKIIAASSEVTNINDINEIKDLLDKKEEIEFNKKAAAAASATDQKVATTAVTAVTAASADDNKLDDKFPVDVFVRMRPRVGKEITENHLAIEYLIKNNKKKKSQNIILKNSAGNNNKRDRKYKGFKYVLLPNDNNMITFNKCIVPSIPLVFKGLAICAFAYGHTGSGKTHTIFGYNNELGMYRLFGRQLCQKVKQLNDDTFIEIRFTELYQNVVRDLLSVDKTECFIREDAKGNVHLRGQTVKYDDGRVIVKPITAVHVTEETEINTNIMEGISSRNVGKSTLHDKSSRSHAFLEFELVNKELVDSRIELPQKESELDAFKRKYDIVKMGVGGNKSKLPKMEKKMKKLKSRIKELKKLIKKHMNNVNKPYIGGTFVFVDLAGNEFGKDVGNKTDKNEEKERNEINKSLFALKECIRGLHQNKKRVPYRSSKLTMYLRKYLKGQGSKAIMITNIGSSKNYTKQTVNTLQYCELIATA